MAAVLERNAIQQGLKNCPSAATARHGSNSSPLRPRDLSVHSRPARRAHEMGGGQGGSDGGLLRAAAKLARTSRPMPKLLGSWPPHSAFGPR